MTEAEAFPDMSAAAVSAETGLVAPPPNERARFFRFLITGGIAACANIVSRWLLELIVSFELAIVIAYLVGMTTAFVLARIFVFEVRKSGIRGQYVRFSLVNLVAFAQVWGISVLLARYVFPGCGLSWHAETLAHIVGVVSPIATSYLGHKSFSFR